MKYIIVNSIEQAFFGQGFRTCKQVTCSEEQAKEAIARKWAKVSRRGLPLTFAVWVTYTDELPKGV